ncbi:MAG: tetratricopeptide repeat protein [Selenomonadaceae bacterium]|nr:tetratricopeptide repeat protein [Selenomonadaceae bacterium]
MNLKKFFVALIVWLSCSTVAAESLEAIFIEVVSEMSDGLLKLDEIRTRPTIVASAEKNFLIEADGYYVTGDGLDENPHVAEERARADARRYASEQINIYVKSVSESLNGNLTRDEIHTISVSVLQVLNESISVEVVGGTKQYHCRIKVSLNEAGIFAQLDSADKDKFHERVRRTIEIERESARLDSELAALKEKFKHASNVERQEIRDEVKRNEEKFSAVQLNKVGYIANYRQDFDAAIENCYKAVELNPNYAAAWNNLGYAYRYKGRLDKAIECYKRAIEFDPTDATAQVNLGNLHAELKNFDAATNCYLAALEIAPDYANAWNSLGYSCLNAGDFDKGIEYCRKALELDKHNAAAWNGLGYAYNRKKKFYKAIECCRKAVSLNKSYANAWNNLGYACSKVSRYEDSFDAYAKAVKFSPNVKLYRDNLAIAQERISGVKSL